MVRMQNRRRFRYNTQVSQCRVTSKSLAAFITSYLFRSSRESFQARPTRNAEEQASRKLTFRTRIRPHKVDMQYRHGNGSRVTSGFAALPENTRLAVRRWDEATTASQQMHSLHHQNSRRGLGHLDLFDVEGVAYRGFDAYEARQYVCGLMTEASAANSPFAHVDSSQPATTWEQSLSLNGLAPLNESHPSPVASAVPLPWCKSETAGDVLYVRLGCLV